MVDSGWAPLFQTIIWLLFIAVLMVIFRRRIEVLVSYLLERIKGGAGIEFGPFRVGSPPPALRSGKAQAATAEGTPGTVTAPPDIETLLLNKDYPAQRVNEAIYLVHEARVIHKPTARTAGDYRVRIWLEVEDESLLRGCHRVVYRLHDTFVEKIVATEAKYKDFELWLDTYGEFTIVAYVDRSPDEPLWLSRYLNLPGRPPD